MNESDLPATVDDAAVRRMKAVAKLLDSAVKVPGTDRRVGADALIGLLPVGGDAVSAAVSLYIVAEAARLGVSYTTLLRMLANVGFDFALGSVPVLGDVFDAFWKANERNIDLVIDDLGGGRERTSEESVQIDVE